MKELFISFLRMSLVSSPPIIAAVLARLFGLPKRARCVLWACAGVRLTIPISFQSVLSLVPPKAVIGEIREVLLPVFEPLGGIYGERIPISKPIPDGVPVAAEAGEAFAEGFDLLWALSAVWIAGFFVMLIYMAACCIRVKLSVRESVRLEENIYICDGISGAFVFGLFRPKIYINSETGEEKTYIIDHEKAHIKRWDHIWKPLSFLLLSFYWFNPLCWAGYILFCRDIELACDEKAIKNYDEKNRILYSKALLKENLTGDNYPLSFGGSGIRERVKNVLNYKKTTFLAAAASAVLCGAVLVCFMTNPISSERLEENNGAPIENTSVAAQIIVNGDSLTAIDKAETESSAAETYASEKTLTPAELEMRKPIHAEDYKYAGFISDKEGNILEYVPNERNEDIPKTSVAPSDIDAILNGLIEAKNYVPDSEDPEIYFGLYTNEEGLDFKASGKWTTTFIPMEAGSEAYALEDGTVIFSGYHKSYGNTVGVENSEGSYIFYAHLSEMAAEKGDSVVKGQIVGYSGTTGLTSYSGIGYFCGDSLPNGL